MTRPTIADLAKAAQVSISTVDRVLNGRDPVRQATADAVLAAAERIGFYGVQAIRSRLLRDKPERRFGFLLQQSHRELYRTMGAQLRAATEAHSDIKGRAVVEFLDDLSDEATAAALVRLGAQVDAVAVVSAEQPLLIAAVEAVSASGVPVFALMGDLSAPSRAGFVGTDNWKLGRTAGWFVAGFTPHGGTVATLVGSHRYMSQDLAEAGFRSHLREARPDLTLIDSLPTHEEPEVAFALMGGLLRDVPDLRAVFVAGGGISGALRAVSAHIAAGGAPVEVICREVSTPTRIGLAEGLIRVALCHPLERMAERLVANMVQVCAAEQGAPLGMMQTVLPFGIVTAENM